MDGKTVMENEKVYAQAKPDKMEKTRTLAEMAMLVALTMIMGLTPLGTIPTPFLSVSIVTVPVALAAIFHGPKGGLICGGVFGLTSLYNAVVGKSVMMATLLSINAFGTIFTALVPRLLEGLITGLVFVALHKVKALKTPSYYIAAVCCPILNTVLFMSSIVLFFYNSDYIQGLVAAKGATNPIEFVVLLVGVQGVVEMIVCLIVAGAVGQGVSRILHRN